MTVFASVAITSFYASLLNTLHNGLVPLFVCIKQRYDTDHVKVIYCYKLRKKSWLGNGSNFTALSFVCPSYSVSRVLKVWHSRKVESKIKWREKTSLWWYSCTYTHIIQLPVQPPVKRVPSPDHVAKYSIIPLIWHPWEHTGAKLSNILIIRQYLYWHKFLEVIFGYCP